MELENKYDYYIHSPIKLHTAAPYFLRGGTAIQGFSSLYAVTKDAAEAITKAGTTSQFKGVVWSERLWLDIDSYEKAQAVENRLVAMELDFIAYDSGGKGAHFGIKRNNAPSHLLPAMDKLWVKANIPEADTTIYTHLHLFRMPGTVHEDTGRPKQLVVENKGRALTLPPMEKINASYRDDSNLYSTDTSVFACFRVMSNSVRTSEGNRHKTFVTLVHALRDDAKATPQLARWWLGEANKLSTCPKSDAELDYLVGSIYGAEK
jgi:hypothetical protein